LQAEKSDVFRAEHLVSFEESDQTNHPANQRREPADRYLSLRTLWIAEVHP
jgi:hypothetical protein